MACVRERTFSQDLRSLGSTSPQPARELLLGAAPRARGVVDATEKFGSGHVFSRPQSPQRREISWNEIV